MQSPYYLASWISVALGLPLDLRHWGRRMMKTNRPATTCQTRPLNNAAAVLNMKAFLVYCREPVHRATVLKCVWVCKENHEYSEGERGEESRN